MNIGDARDGRRDCLLGSKRLRDDLIIEKHNNDLNFLLPSQMSKRSKQGTELYNPSSFMSSMYMERLQHQAGERSRGLDSESLLSHFSPMPSDITTVAKRPRLSSTSFLSSTDQLQQLQAMLSSQGMVHAGKRSFASSNDALILGSSLGSANDGDSYIRLLAHADENKRNNDQLQLENDHIFNTNLATRRAILAQTSRLLAMQQEQQKRNSAYQGASDSLLLSRLGGIPPGISMPGILCKKDEFGPPSLPTGVNTMRSPIPGLTFCQPLTTTIQNQLSFNPTTIGNKLSASANGRNCPGPWTNLQLGQRSPVDVYMACDDEILSDQQILLRKQIQYFEASLPEVEAVAHGRKNKIKIGQVGLRCKHCASLLPTRRPKGAVYYPGSLRALYQAAQNMAVGHFMVSCEVISEGLKMQLKAFQERKSSPGHAGKKYWAECAKAVGIVETENDGLSFRKQQ